MKKPIKRYAPPVVWALFIAVLCGLPGKDIPHISLLELLNFDKFVHASLFFILVILIYRAVRQTPNRKNAMVYALCLSVPYGGILEILQQELFKDRAADLLDFTANSLGCLLAWGYISFQENRKIKSLIYSYFNPKN